MKHLSYIALLALGISGLGGCAAQATEDDGQPAPELAEGSGEVGTQMACYSVRHYESAAYESYRQCTVANPTNSGKACKGALDYWIKWSNLAEAQGCY